MSSQDKQPVHREGAKPEPPHGLPNGEGEPEKGARYPKNDKCQ